MQVIIKKIKHYTSDLLVDAHSVEAVVHDVHPAVLGGQHKQRHQRVENVVKIVFLIDPAILRKLANKILHFNSYFIFHLSFVAMPSSTCKHCSLVVMF